MPGYIRLALLVGVSLKAVSLVSAPATSATDPLAAYDVRNDLRIGVSRPAPLFRPGEALTGPDGRDATAIVRDYLKRSALTQEGERRAEFKPYAASAGADNALQHVYLETEFFGVPVFDGDVAAHLDREGRLLRLQRGDVPEPPARLAPALSARQAVESALQALAPDQTAPLQILEQDAGPRRQSTFQHPAVKTPIAASLVWFPLGAEARAAWRIYVDLGSNRAYQLVIDADDGVILFSINLVREIDPIGLVHAAPAIPHPAAGSATVQPLSGWPAQAGGACPAAIYPAGVSGCWTDGTDSSGNNIDACVDLNGDEVCDSRALGVGGSFVFSFADSFSLANDPAPDRNFALVNAFYWTNALHDWLYGLGFNEAAGNFQSDNFSRGGQGSDAVRVDIHDGFSNNQASFLTPPDGIAPRMNLGLFTGLRRDSALDGDIMTHEYAHGVTSRLVGGPLNAASLYLLQSAALSEGWSDAFAFAFTGDPIIGEYVTRSTATGIRTVRYDQSSLTFGELGVRRATMLPIQNRLAGLPQPHIDGEIWASTLWDVRQAVGVESFPRLLVESLKMTPPRPSMLEARDAVIQTAAALGLGGQHACSVWNAFAARGMGASAALNPVAPGEAPDTAVSVYEAFDAPAFCGGAPPDLGPVIHAEDAESASGWTATGLWHRSTLRAASGAYSWRFGRHDAADYNTGQRETGDLVSPVIDLTAASGAVVEWDQFLRTEGFWRRYYLGGVFGPYLNLDSARLWVSADEGPWRAVTHLAHPTPGDGFVRHRVNLSRFAGQAIRLRFDFDSFTASANAHEGLYIDNLRLSALGSAPPKLSVTPSGVELSAVLGQPTPPASVEVRNSGGGSMPWTATLLSGHNWLAVAPNKGTGLGAVSLYPAPSAVGLYEATLRINAGAAGTIDIPINLSVTEPAAVIAEWRLDETGDGGGVSIAGQDPGITSGPGSLAIPGVSGGARRFNGWTDGVSTAWPVDLPDRFTVRAWVRLTNTPHKLALVTSSFGGANARGWYLGVGSDRRAIWMAAQPPNSTPWLISQSMLEPGRWHMLTVTYDRAGEHARLYVDGVFDSARDFPGLAQDTATPLTLGKASWAENYHFPGAIDEVCIESGVRSETEIAADFETGSPPPRPGNLDVRANWRFDQSNRGDDSSGNGRHAAALSGQTVSGVSGQSLALNGSTDAVQIAGHEQLAPNDFTVAFWARVLSTPGSQGGVLVSDLSPLGGWEIALDPQGRVQATLASNSDGAVTFTAHPSLPLGQWKRLALAYRSWSRLALLYVDGQLAAQKWLPGGATPRANGNLTVGRSATGTTRFAHFEIDELSILARPWTATEATVDFGLWSPPSPPSPVEEPPVDDPPAPALIASWDFDETATAPGTVLVDAVAGHNAATTAAGTYPVQGLSGPARRFGGWPDSASIASSPELHTDSFSYSTWIKIQEAPANWGAVYATNDGAYSGWLLGVYKDARIIFSVAGPPDSQPWLLSSDSLRLGRWHHVAVTFDGPTRRAAIYLDGQRVGGATFPSWRPSTSLNPTIGRASWGQSGFLKFTADRMRLYNHERSAAQTAAEFGELAALRRPELIGRWEMDDLLTDSGPGGRHGSFTGSGGVAVEGRFGAARRFQGRPDAGVLSPDPAWATQSFTYSAWVKLESIPGSWGTLFSTYDGDYRGWFVGVHGDGRVILCVAGKPAFSPWLLSRSAITPGRWNHVAIAFDAVSRRGTIYIDGSAEASTVFPAYTPTDAVSPTIARASWTDSYYLAADVDRMRLEPMALSVQQVLEMVME